MTLDPKERLRRFVALAEALRLNGRYPDCLNGILHLGIDIRGDGNSFPTAEMTDVDNDLLRSYLVTFRRLTLNDDPCYLPGVLRAADLVLTGTRSESRIKKAMARIKYHRNTGYPVSFNGDWPTRKPEEMFKIWIYGKPDGFHYEPGSKESKAWNELANIPAGRGQLTGMVYQFIRAIDREVHHVRKLVLPHIPD